MSISAVVKLGLLFAVMSSGCLAASYNPEDNMQQPASTNLDQICLGNITRDQSSGGPAAILSFLLSGSSWMLSSDSNISFSPLTASVPGYPTSTLRDAGLIGDPLYRFAPSMNGCFISRGLCVHRSSRLCLNYECSCSTLPHLGCVKTSLTC